MKTLLLSIGLGMVLLNGLSTASAQIRDNESSVTALAIQCAVSSGFSAQDYEEYCRSLAKTIGMLSSAQQTRVFGYLPMPGGAATAETAATVETAPVQAATATTSTKTTPEVTNTTTAAAKVVDSATPSQTATESAKTVGSISPATTTNSTNSGGSSSNGNSLLDFIIQLLRGATSSTTQKL